MMIIWKKINITYIWSYEFFNIIVIDIFILLFSKNVYFFVFIIILISNEKNKKADICYCKTKKDC